MGAMRKRKVRLEFTRTSNLVTVKSDSSSDSRQLEYKIWLQQNSGFIWTGFFHDDQDWGVLKSSSRSSKLIFPFSFIKSSTDLKGPAHPSRNLIVLKAHDRYTPKTYKFPCYWPLWNSSTTFALPFFPCVHFMEALLKPHHLFVMAACRTGPLKELTTYFDKTSSISHSR